MNMDYDRQVVILPYGDRIQVKDATSGHMITTCDNIRLARIYCFHKRYTIVQEVM
jgi:hypothetical protein